MIFTVLDDIFKDDSDPNTKRLDRLFLLLDRHTFYIKDPDAIENLLDSDWFKGLRISYKNKKKSLKRTNLTHNRLG